MPSPVAVAEDELNLLDLLIVLAKHKWLILVVPFVAALVGVIISIRTPDTYTASAKLLPPQQAQGASSLLAQFGSLGSLATGALGLKNPGDVYVGMLRSRTVSDALIERLHLIDEYKVTRLSEARDILTAASQIIVGKDGLITLDVSDGNPKRAAELANGYIEELIRLTGVLAVTEAGQRRVFFERQLNQTKENLIKAEIAAKAAMDQGGLAGIDAQGRTMLQTGASLRAQVTSKEVELNSMRGFATEQNPQFNRVQQELTALREQLTQLESGSRINGAKPGNGSESGLKNTTLLRELRYQELLFEMLARQTELAKVDEARDGAVIQVLDRAIEPERRSGPKRTLTVLTWATCGFLASIALAFIKEWFQRAKGNPESSRRMEQLATYLNPRR